MIHNCNFDMWGKIQHQWYQQDKESFGYSSWKSVNICRVNRQSWEQVQSQDSWWKFPMEWPTSVKLHKYTWYQMQKVYSNHFSNTLSQRIEVDWLARQLWHDIQVHRDVYHLCKSTIETSRVRKLLLTIHHGETWQFTEKALTRIDLNA